MNVPQTRAPGISSRKRYSGVGFVIGSDANMRIHANDSNRITNHRAQSIKQHQKVNKTQSDRIIAEGLLIDLIVAKNNDLDKL